MSQRNLVIITKIILFYSIFYVGLKLFIISRGGWVNPNLLLALPFLVLAIVGGILVYKEKYSWLFATIGTVAIILTRVYESRWVLWLQQQVGS